MSESLSCGHTGCTHSLESGHVMFRVVDGWRCSDHYPGMPDALAMILQHHNLSSGIRSWEEAMRDAGYELTPDDDA